MIRFLLICLLVFILLQYFTQCAQVGFITGGLKDTIPPILIESYPANGTTNFKDKTIRLTFDEWVNADKIKSSLLLAPAYPIKYSVVNKKNMVTLKLETNLLDSTTYTFNFTTGITDITEKNPGENISVSFSTGDKIDTLTIRGWVKELYSNSTVKSNIVALYPISDTLDILKNKPKYIANTDETGMYQFSFIKPDNYRVLTFKDENKNQIIDPTTESYGFYPDTLRLIKNIDSINMYTYKLDFSPLKLISAKSFGRYYDIKYSKALTGFQFESLTNDTLPYIPAYFHDGAKTIRVIPFFTNLTSDSLSVKVTAIDTLEQTQVDTVTIKFIKSTRKPDENKITLSPIKTSIYDSINFTIESTKPIKYVNETNIRTKLLDSLYFNSSAIKYYFNEKRTKVFFTMYVDWNTISDSLYRYRLDQLPDSIDRTDSLNLPKRVEAKSLTIELEPSTIKTFEDDSIPKSTIQVTRKNPKELGKLLVTFETTESSYFVQLLTKDLKNIKTIVNQSTFEISEIQPGTYLLKILFDTNNNGKYNLGNILLNRPEEKIYHYPKELIIKSNWELTVDDISF